MLLCGRRLQKRGLILTASSGELFSDCELLGLCRRVPVGTENRLGDLPVCLLPGQHAPDASRRWPDGVRGGLRALRAVASRSMSMHFGFSRSTSRRGSLPTTWRASMSESQSWSLPGLSAGVRLSPAPSIANEWARWALRSCTPSAAALLSSQVPSWWAVVSSTSLVKEKPRGVAADQRGSGGGIRIPGQPATRGTVGVHRSSGNRNRSDRHPDPTRVVTSAAMEQTRPDGSQTSLRPNLWEARRSHRRFSNRASKSWPTPALAASTTAGL